MKKSYTLIDFPIEQDFSREYKFHCETISLPKFVVIKLLKFFEPIFLSLIGVNRLYDRKWPTYSESNTPDLICVLNPFLFVDHSHVMTTAFDFKVEVNHFIYILYRKIKLAGNKSVYPVCLNDNFGLKATYEMSNIVQENVFKSNQRQDIDTLYFSNTNSFSSLLVGRRIIGKIKSQDYNYLINRY
jgi:hypothetical protein